MSIVDEIKEAVIAGSAKKVKDAVERAVAAGLAVEAILHDGLIAGMDIIGARFKVNEVYVPEVLVAARAMHAGLDVIKPLIVSSGIKEKGVIVIGTVQGDLHDIGKNLVVMMLEGAGYRVVNLGVDVPVDAFIRSVEEHRPQVVGLSALLTTTMPKLAETVAPGVPRRGQGHRGRGPGDRGVRAADRRRWLCRRRGERRGGGGEARRLAVARAGDGCRPGGVCFSRDVLLLAHFDIT
jgi:5-methyltetrahydrofolate--homocysteine methyltransferase